VGGNDAAVTAVAHARAKPPAGRRR